MNVFKIHIILLLTFFLSACENQQRIVLFNPSTYELVDHAIIIDRDTLGAPESEKLLPVFRNETGEAVPLQLEDTNQDGAWDQVIFQYSFTPMQESVLTLEWTAIDGYPVFENRTNVHLGLSSERNDEFVSVQKTKRPDSHIAQSKPFLYQYEGPGWESELVAFRSYFDSRNGKDIFGKTTPQLYSKSIGLNENYHTLQDWGMDILKVGSSLGAGALAMLKNDSIYRLGGTREARFEVLTNGPVKSSFRLTYAGWEVAGQSYDLEETITIWGGKRWFQSDVKLIGTIESDTLVTGIVNLKNAPKKELSMDNWQLLYSHGEQSENHDQLGMALLIADKYSAGFSEAPKHGDGVTDTYTAYLKSSNGLYSFLFYAGWEGENNSFSDRQYFETQLKNEIQDINQSIIIELE